MNLVALLSQNLHSEISTSLGVQRIEFILLYLKTFLLQDKVLECLYACSFTHFCVHTHTRTQTHTCVYSFIHKHLHIIAKAHTMLTFCTCTNIYSETKSIWGTFCTIINQSKPLYNHSKNYLIIFIRIKTLR